MTKSKQDIQSVFLSEEAWEFYRIQTRRLKYLGRSAEHGTSAYIHALFKANPKPSDWRDTRPQSLTRFDKPRAENYMTRMWFDFNTIGARESHLQAARRQGRTITISNAGKRNLNTAVYNAILPQILDIALGHDLYHPKFPNLPSPKHTTTAVLEAIGLGYLSYRQEAPECPNPVKPFVYRRRYEITF